MAQSEGLTRRWCYEELMTNSVIYGASWDFDPDNAYLMEERAWTHNEKWFMSYIALADLEYMLCLN